MQGHRLLILMGLLIAITGCALKPTAQKTHRLKPSAKTAIVYFYRPRSPVGAAISVDVQHNGIDLGTLSNGTYLPYPTNPGPHTFTLITDTTVTQSLRLQAGRTYYVRVRIDKVGLKYRLRLDVVSDLQGQAAIHNLQKLNYWEHRGAPH